MGWHTITTTSVNFLKKRKEEAQHVGTVKDCLKTTGEREFICFLTTIPIDPRYKWAVREIKTYFIRDQVLLDFISATNSIETPTIFLTAQWLGNF